MRCGGARRQCLSCHAISAKAIAMTLPVLILTFNIYASAGEAKAEGGSSLPYILGLVGLGFVGLMAFGLARRPRSGSASATSSGPVSELSRTLANEDCRALTMAMTELAQGNLTAQLAIRSKPLDPDSIPEMRDFAVALNTVVESLQDTAREFNAVTETPCRRTCYVGADSFLEGQACAQAMGEALGRTGKVLIITSTFKSSGPELRRKGFLSTLHDQFPGIELIASVEATEAADRMHDKTAEVLQR